MNRRSLSWSSRCPCRRNPRRSGPGPGASIKDLFSAIGAFIDHWNDHPSSFAWTKDADEILGTTRRAKTKVNALTDHQRLQMNL